MTREEAIEYNKNLRMYMKLSDKNQPCKFLEDNYIALDMAIKALEQEPCDDCISRQAALDAFGLSEITRKYGGDHSGYDTVMKYEIQDILEGLPPVNSQKNIVNNGTMNITL